MARALISKLRLRLGVWAMVGYRFRLRPRLLTLVRLKSLRPPRPRTTSLCTRRRAISASFWVVKGKAPLDVFRLEALPNPATGVISDSLECTQSTAIHSPKSTRKILELTDVAGYLWPLRESRRSRLAMVMGICSWVTMVRMPPWL